MLLFGALFLTLSSPLLLAQSPPKGVETATKRDFYPPGTRWKEKKISADGKSKVVEHVVLDDTEYNSTRVVKVSIGKGKVVKIYDQKTLAFIAHQVGGKDVMTALPHDGRYNWPLWVGKSWVAPFDFQIAKTKKTIKVDKKYSVTAFETVTVPAGSFKAYKVVGEPASNTKSSIILWWSPKINKTVKIAHFRGTKNIITYELVTIPSLP